MLLRIKLIKIICHLFFEKKINHPQKICSVTTNGSASEELVVLKKRDEISSSNRKAKRDRLFPKRRTIKEPIVS